MTLPPTHDSEYRIPQEYSERPRPWIRFWARYVDISFFGGFASISAADVAKAPVGQGIVVSAGGLLGALLLEALIVHWFGNSPGKAILGLRIQRVDGGKPILPQLIQRNFRCWWAGHALGIFPITLMCWLRARRLCNEGHTMSWDAKNGLRTIGREVPPWRIFLIVGVGFVAWYVIFALVALLRS